MSLTSENMYFPVAVFIF